MKTKSRGDGVSICVVAPCHGSTTLGEVVIEVKWSTNDEIRTGLKGQLGQNYLIGEGRTHGIFLVAWSGEWRPADGTGWNYDQAALLTFLTGQRDEFQKVGQPGEGLSIHPLVIDIRWRV